MNRYIVTSDLRFNDLNVHRFSAAAGKLVFGGPIFDDVQKPIGSFLLADCADRAELNALIANDPYTRANVWQRVEVKPVRLVVQDGKITP